MNVRDPADVTRVTGQPLTSVQIAIRSDVRLWNPTFCPVAMQSPSLVDAKGKRWPVPRRLNEALRFGAVPFLGYPSSQTDPALIQPAGVAWGLRRCRRYGAANEDAEVVY